MIRVWNTTRDVSLGERVEQAQSFGARLRGLLGRRGWGEEDGLWIEPCAGVHTIGMRFPVDIVLVDEGLRVLWAETLRPYRLGRIHLGARSALELPEGTLSRGGTTRGDLLRIEPIGDD